MNSLRLMLVTTFGLGFMRPASGTWGSMPPVALVAILLALGAQPVFINLVLIATLCLFSFACLRHGAWAEAKFAKKDPGFIVADETAGQSLTLLALPWGALAVGKPLVGGLTWPGVATLATGFLLFRIMDIVKPPPARGLQRLRGGVGVLIDDLLAGLYAALLTQLFARALMPFAL